MLEDIDVEALKERLRSYNLRELDDEFQLIFEANTVEELEDIIRPIEDIEAELEAFEESLEFVDIEELIELIESQPEEMVMKDPDFEDPEFDREWMFLIDIYMEIFEEKSPQIRAIKDIDKEESWEDFKRRAKALGLM